VEDDLDPARFAALSAGGGEVDDPARARAARIATSRIASFMRGSSASASVGSCT
jgi:hypothetical protein